MADYYTQFSIVVPTTSDEENKFIIDRIKGYYIEDPQPDSKEVVEDMKSWGIDYHACNYREEENEGLWLYDDEGPDIDKVAFVISLWQKKFCKEEPMVIQFSCSCSKPRLDAFGGGVLVCYKGKTLGKNTWTVGEELLKKLGYKRENKNVSAVTQS